MPIVHIVRVFVSLALLAWILLCKFFTTSLHLDLIFIQFNFFFFCSLYFKTNLQRILLIVNNRFINWLLLIFLTIFISNFFSWFSRSRLLDSWSLLYNCCCCCCLCCVLFWSVLFQMTVVATPLAFINFGLFHTSDNSILLIICCRFCISDNFKFSFSSSLSYNNNFSLVVSLCC